MRARTLLILPQEGQRLEPDVLRNTFDPQCSIAMGRSARNLRLILSREELLSPDPPKDPGASGKARGVRFLHRFDLRVDDKGLIAPES